MSHVINQLKEQAKGNVEVLDFIDNQISSRLAGSNPKYEIPSQGEVEHVIDYLLSKQAPKKLRKASYEQMKEGAAKWVERMNKKAGGIVETEEDVEIIKIWKSGMRLVQLVGENAYKREGKLMSHCVAGYYGKSECKIYSIRDSNNNPHCTIEVMERDGQINQIKGKGNGSIHPKYINYVLKSLKKIGKEIRESELQYLGYVPLSEAGWKYFDRVYSNVQYMNFQGKRFLYKGTKLKKKISEKEYNALVQELNSIEY